MDPNNTLMTDVPAANTTEGQAASQSATDAAATAQPAQQGDQAAQQQQADAGQVNADGQQTEGDAKPEGDKAQEAAQPKAPEKYEFKAQDGVTYDDQVLTNFAEVAKELDLSQDAAQKILDKVAPVMQARQVEAIEAAKTQWAESAKTDKEFGGDKLPENLAVAKKALDTFGTPELRTLLNESGLGNHPEIIRAFYRAGKAISEDSFVAGGKGVSQPQSTAQRMYPNMNP